MPSIIQRSFAGGIVGPELAGRAEQTKYQTGLKDALNVIVQRYGGVTNRPGSRFIAETRDGDAESRLFKFAFNAEQTYILEFGELYMRVYRDGGAVVPSAAAWSAATTYLIGDMASLAGVVYYCIADHINHTPPNATYWAPMTAGFYEIPTPYAAADLRGIQYVQSADVVTLVHPDYAPRELRRTGHTAWLLTLKSFAPGVDRPANCAATAGGAGANSYRYQVTAFDRNTLEESYPGRETARAITGATQANPCALTIAAHPYSTGDEIYVDGIAGMTQLNGRTFVVTKTGANTVTLDGEDSTGHTAYTSGGTAARPYVRLDAAAAPTTSAPHVISAANPGVGFGLWFYRYKDGVFQYIGEANGNASAATISFSDNNIGASAALTPPIERDLFNEPGGYPSTVTYVKQRLALANTEDAIERVWLSQVGNYSNFTKSSPIQNDDAIEFQLSGRQVNAVRHIIEVGGRLVVLTDSSEWVVKGENGAITATGALNPEQQGYDGSAAIAPVIIGNTALYVQARGSFLRDLRYDYESDGYQGRDLTVFCPELFDGYSIVAMDYQKIPHSVDWLVRDDGAMLGLTYVRDHEVWGWHRHLTAGTDTYKDVCSVSEGSEDAVYVIVRRLVDGVWTRYVERFASRRFTDIAVDAFFVDSGLTYDGRNTGATTMTITGGTAWDESEELTCTASASTFGASNVGDEVVLYVEEEDPDTEEIETARYACVITGYTSPTVVTVRPDRALPVSVRATATTAWALAVGTVAGLDHLEGRTVTALCDGNVNPEAVVTGGSIDLASPAVIAHVGLPYTARIETLDAENLQGETWTDKKRKVHKVGVRVKDTRGLWIGFGDGQLFEHEDEQAKDYDDPIPLFTGLIEENVDTTWEKSGKVIVEQRDPLPMTILSVIPVGSIGGT